MSRRVLLLHSSAGRYGADRQLALLATGLDPERWVPIVVLPGEGPLASELRAAGVEVHVRPLAVVRRSLVSPRGMSRIAAAWAADAGGLGRLARRRGVALVHTNTSVTLGGAAAARIAQVPHVWHVREIYTDFDRWFPAYRRLLLTADALPCVSAATAAQFDGAAVHVVPDGIALHPRPAPRDAARAALGLDPAAFVVALLGRLSPWKGQDQLIGALPRLEGAVALLAGSAWEGEAWRERELRQLAERLGVADRARFVGFRDDVETVLGAADAVAVPSTQPDPLPNAALEAAAAGLPVVAAAHGGLPDVVRHEATGLLVPPGNVGALAGALARLRDEPGLAERLGAAAARDVPARFSPGALLERVQALYDALAPPS